MKNILLKLIFSIIAIFIFSKAISSQSIAIAIDGSGSMRGYFKAGSLEKYIDDKYEKFVSFFPSDSNGKVDKIFFINKEILPYEPAPRTMGDITVLDISFKKILAKKYDIIFLITDNVQDTEEDSITTVAFYKELAKEEIREVNVAPELLDFNGNVILRDYSVPHTGKRGILSYLILINDNYRSYYYKFLSLFKENVLLIKPITNKNIKIIGVRQNEIDVVKQSVMNLLSKCSGAYSKIILPNVEIVSNGSIVPYDKENPPSFSLDKQNLLNFFFSLESILEHINIGNDNNPCDREIKLEVNNLTILPKRLKDKIFFNNIKTLGKIAPPSLIGSLKKNETYKYYYYCEVRFGPFEYNWNLLDFFQYLRFNSIKLKMNFDITLTVPPNYFSLTEEYRNKYFTNDINEYNKIYSPVDLVQFINTEPVIINLKLYSY